MNTKEKLIDLANDWPGDNDNFIQGGKMNLADEAYVESYVNKLGFNMYWTGNGYLLAIKIEDE
jgi:hypothetical protein